MKVMVIMGTRPEIIKLAPVVFEFEKRGHEVVLVHTGQHYTHEMSGVFFNNLGLRNPDYNIEAGSDTHARQTAKMLIGIESLLIKERPNFVIVQGDTNSTFAGAVAAVKLLIPIVHVEAGLRSNDWRMPEEHNRVMIDHIADFNFAPTNICGNNLIEEQVHGLVYTVGNTIIDIVEKIAREVERPDWLSYMNIDIDNYALMTYHRAENLVDTEHLKAVIMELAKLPIDIIFPIHPRTKDMLYKDGFVSPINIHITEPVGYKVFISLLKYCQYVITDSGGIQEEATAPSIRKKVFVLRRTTERREAISAGYAILLGDNPSVYVNMIQANRNHIMDFGKCPYGDGNTAKQIVDILESAREVY